MSTLYEILELSTGEIVLKRMDDNDTDQGEVINSEELEPLVSIKFSEEALFFLGSAKIEIAKAMIEAGLNHAGNLELLGDKDELIAASDDTLENELKSCCEDPTYH